MQKFPINVAGSHQITQALPSLQMGKLSAIAILALFSILLLDPKNCLASSPVPSVLSECRKYKTGTDEWNYHARILRGRGRDKDQPRGNQPAPVRPPGNRP